MNNFVQNINFQFLSLIINISICSDSIWVIFDSKIRVEFLLSNECKMIYLVYVYGWWKINEYTITILKQNFSYILTTIKKIVNSFSFKEYCLNF